MKHNVCEKFQKDARTPTVFGAILVTAVAMATAGTAAAQQITVPPNPFNTDGNTAFLVGHAEGTQGYVCLPKDGGASWTVNGARPEATLFTSIFGVDFQIITHFLSPDTNPNDAAPKPLPAGNATWQSSLDTSKVWAQASDSILAGSGVSCPNAGSIACLLLTSIGSAEGPAGGKSLTQVSLIERLNTNGGSAPATGCSVTGDVGKQALVPYTADYYFFHKNK